MYTKKHANERTHSHRNIQNGFNSNHQLSVNQNAIKFYIIPLKFDGLFYVSIAYPYPLPFLSWMLSCSIENKNHWKTVQNWKITNLKTKKKWKQHCNMPERWLFKSILFLARVFRFQINLLFFNVLRAFGYFFIAERMTLWLLLHLDYY